MKKSSSSKLALAKKTIATLEIKMQKMIQGGVRELAYTSESCPGDQCPSERNSCNLSCNDYPKCNHN